MGVNFQTPDPGIIERPYVQQIPLEALFKNLAYKQEKYDIGLQQARQKIDTLNNIASYGQDTEVKNQMFNTLNAELSKLAGANYGDQAVQSQIDGLVAGFTTNGDIAKMHARAITFEKMQKEAQDAALKGKTYYNRGYDQALKYYANGEYNKDVAFSDNGKIAPDMATIRDKILAMKNVTREESAIENGRIVKRLVVDGEAAAKEFKNLASQDLDLADYLDYTFNKTYGDLSPDEWKSKGQEFYLKKGESSVLIATEANKAIQLELAKGAKASKDMIALYEATRDKYMKDGEDYVKAANNPDLVGADYKAALFDEYLTNESSNFGKSKELSVVTDFKDDGKTLESLRATHALQHDQIMEQYKAITPGALALGYSPVEALGDPTKMKEAMAKTQELAAEKVYNEALARQKAKTTAVGNKLTSDKVLDSEIIEIGGQPLTKGEWKRIIGTSTAKNVPLKEADKKFIVAIIKENPSAFSMLSAEQITNLNEGTLEIKSDGTIEYDDSNWPWGSTPIITKSDLAAALNAVKLGEVSTTPTTPTTSTTTPIVVDSTWRAVNDTIHF